MSGALKPLSQDGYRWPHQGPQGAELHKICTCEVFELVKCSNVKCSNDELCMYIRMLVCACVPKSKSDSVTYTNNRKGETGSTPPEGDPQPGSLFS